LLVAAQIPARSDERRRSEYRQRRRRVLDAEVAVGDTTPMHDRIAVALVDRRIEERTALVEAVVERAEGDEEGRRGECSCQ
jgi:hypothetical protein